MYKTSFDYLVLAYYSTRPRSTKTPCSQFVDRKLVKYASKLTKEKKCLFKTTGDIIIRPRMLLIRPTTFWRAMLFSYCCRNQGLVRFIPTDRLYMCITFCVHTTGQTTYSLTYFFSVPCYM